MLLNFLRILQCLPTKSIVLFSLLFFPVYKCISQVGTTRIIQSAAPFLLVNPDARTGGMGDAGLAIISDRNPTATNPSKIGLSNTSFGVSMSYSPWLKSLANDINLAYVGGFYKVKEGQALAASIKYMSMGKFELTDTEKQFIGIYTPSEAAFDISYIKAFGGSLSMAITGRYIYSTLQNSSLLNANLNNINDAFGIDITTIYKRETLMLEKDVQWSIAAAATNIGSKIDYSITEKRFLPANLKIGGALNVFMDETSSFTLSGDISKLLIPTPNINKQGMDLDQSVTSAIFNSFTDAPDGLSEEFKEIQFACGAEYSYNKQFAFRFGYFYEHPQKGFRRYLTFGAGFYWKTMGLDVAYIAANPVNNPLANTVRLSLAINAL